jgi:hypothetical protein
MRYRQQLEFLKILRQFRQTLLTGTTNQELDLLGIYFLVGPPETWDRRLILDGRGSYTMGHWVEAGGYYRKMETGTYYIAENQIIPSTRNITFPLPKLIIARHPDTDRPQLLPGQYTLYKVDGEVFIQAEFPTVMTCIATEHTGYVFTNSLTLGNHYLVLSHDPAKNRFVLINDRGRTRIYPAAIFQRKGLI